MSHSVMRQLSYQSALIGATNGNRLQPTRSAQGTKFISNSLEQEYGNPYDRLCYREEMKEMSRVDRNSGAYSIWLSRASRKTVPLLT